MTGFLTVLRFCVVLLVLCVAGFFSTQITDRINVAEKNLGDYSSVYKSTSDYICNLTNFNEKSK